MREKAEKVALDGLDALDTCGTGGDGTGTFNVSTAVALVAASAGVKVAKHGNRSATSLCGCADVLEELGVNINQTPDQVRSCVENANIGFMFAPLYHKSMRFVANTRKQLGFRTIFNILGPLSNPAGAAYQVLGVFHPNLVEIMAMVLNRLGTKHAMVVHGSGGMDEISMTGPTLVSEIRDGRVENYMIKPEDYGFKPCALGDLKGGTKEENAAILKGLLKGERSPKRDMLLLNAGAALYVAGKASGIGEGINMAAEAIDSGRALNILDRFVQVSSAHRPGFTGSQ
jgi:anthranilate phosphoribosyltransferase